MNTNNTKFNNKKTFRKHCYNINTWLLWIHILYRCHVRNDPRSARNALFPKRTPPRWGNHSLVQIQLRSSINQSSQCTVPRVPHARTPQSIRIQWSDAFRAEQPTIPNTQSYKEISYQLVKPSLSGQQQIPCMPTSGWQSAKRPASLLPGFVPAIVIQCADCQGTHRSASLHR